MLVWTYSIVDNTVPPGLDSMRFRTEVARALRYVEKVSDENVRFVHRGMLRADSLVDPDSHVNIGFDDQLKPGEVGQQWSNRKPDGRTVHSIAFDPSVKWQSRWWHKWLSSRPDIYTVCVHEIGHLLGLPHNMHPTDVSVMTPGAVFSEFSPREIEQLQKANA